MREREGVEAYELHTAPRPPSLRSISEQLYGDDELTKKLKRKKKCRRGIFIYFFVIVILNLDACLLPYVRVR